MPTFSKSASVATVSALLLVAMWVLTGPSRSVSAEGEGLGTGTQVTVTELEDRGFVTGFVATGSESPVVLCALNENAPGYGSQRLSGVTVFCRNRAPDFGSGAVPGVAIVVALPEDFRPTRDEDIALVVSVFHQNAAFYGELQSCEQQCW